MGSRWLAKGAGLLAGSVLVSQVALACPQCVRGEGGGYGMYVLIGSMILLPFAVAAAAVHFIRRADFDNDVK